MKHSFTKPSVFVKKLELLIEVSVLMVMGVFGCVCVLLSVVFCLSQSRDPVSRAWQDWRYIVCHGLQAVCLENVSLFFYLYFIYIVWCAFKVLEY